MFKVAHGQGIPPSNEPKLCGG